MNPAASAARSHSSVEKVAMCNFAVMYFFPMFFETVMLTSSSTAGERVPCQADVLGVDAGTRRATSVAN